MLPLLISLLVLLAVYGPLVANTFVGSLGIHIVAMGAIFRCVGMLLNRAQAAIVLIVAGFLFDSSNFSENFGMTVFLLLFLYGLHASVTDERARFEGRLDFLAVQVFNSVFFLCELFFSNRNLWEFTCLVSLILSQIFAYWIDVFAFGMAKRLDEKTDRNPFGTAQNFFQK